MMYQTRAELWFIVIIVISIHVQPLFFVGCVTIQEVAQHSSEDDCWTVVDETVYDVTAYAPNHPQRGWGASSVYRMCGIDATQLYDQYHANEHDYLTSMSTIITIGAVTTATSPPQTIPPTTRPPTPSPSPLVSPITEKPTTGTPTSSPTEQPGTIGTTTRPSTEVPVRTLPPSTEPTTAPPTKKNVLITSTDLAQHNTENDCWVAYFDAGKSERMQFTNFRHCLQPTNAQRFV
jgi:cytochrome b involved in lipid metabolism